MSAKNTKPDKKNVRMITYTTNDGKNGQGYVVKIDGTLKQVNFADGSIICLSEQSKMSVVSSFGTDKEVIRVNESSQ